MHSRRADINVHPMVFVWSDFTCLMSGAGHRKKLSRHCSLLSHCYSITTLLTATLEAHAGPVVVVVVVVVTATTVLPKKWAFSGHEKLPEL